MQTKRDQLQAHNFVVGRLRSALLRGDADAPETPTRRFSAATFAGILVGALLVAGCGVYGMVAPGGNRTWRQPGTIIVERETGTRYLFIDDTLRPVLNIPSARLLAGSGAKVRSVSTKSLRGVPHGLPIGIPGAPDSLPDPARLVTDSWLVCVTEVVTGPNSTRPGVSVSVGQRPSGVRPFGDGAIPLVTPDGSLHLAWRDRRLRIEDSSALVAFGYRSVRSVPVPSQWLNAVPQGPDLTAPTVDGPGQAGPTVGGRSTRVGQVLAAQTTTGTRDYYLVLRDGLAAVSPAAAGLLLADPDSRAAYDPEPVRALDVAFDAVVAAVQSSTTPDWTGLPTTPPNAVEPVDEGEAPCAELTFGGDGEPVTTLVLARPAVASGAAQGGDTTADQVTVPAGRGMLARSQPSPGSTAGALYLVTDLGIKYPLPSAEVAATLGYGNTQPVAVPTMMLAFLPTGPALDPGAAGATFLGW